MWVFRVTLCVVVGFSLHVFAKEKKAEPHSLTLLDETGKAQAPKDRKLSLSFIALISYSNGEKRYFCNAIHLKNGYATLPESCLSHLGKEQNLELTFFDKGGIQQTHTVDTKNIEGKPQECSSLRIKDFLDKEWPLTTSNPKKVERWFGGFRPEWELLRTWGYTALGDNRFQMQINSCKGTRKIPFIQRIKVGEDKSEQTLEETRVFEKDSPFSQRMVVEDCIKVLDPSTPGALITLAMDFETKFGLLDQAVFSPFGERSLSSLSSTEEHVILRYMGADGIEQSLPKELGAVPVYFAYPFSGASNAR